MANHLRRSYKASEDYLTVFGVPNQDPIRGFWRAGARVGLWPFTSNAPMPSVEGGKMRLQPDERIISTRPAATPNYNIQVQFNAIESGAGTGIVREGLEIYLNETATSYLSGNPPKSVEGTKHLCLRIEAYRPIFFPQRRGFIFRSEWTETSRNDEGDNEDSVAYVTMAASEEIITDQVMASLFNGGTVRVEVRNDRRYTAFLNGVQLFSTSLPAINTSTNTNRRRSVQTGQGYRYVGLWPFTATGGSAGFYVTQFSVKDI